MAIPLGGDGSGDAPARLRVRLPGISSRAYEHPADRSALVALRAVPGFDSVLKAISGLLRERSHRYLFLASAVRVSDRQFRGVHAMWAESLEVLDLPESTELYVTQSPYVVAMTLGMDRPFVVVSTASLDLFDDEELRFVLGHELGHLLSGHAVYRTMLLHLVRLASRAVWLPLGYLGVRAVVVALEEWFRKSELSGDRAGLLAGQDSSAGLRALMKLAGGARVWDMDADGFLAQAAEYEAAGDLRDGVIKLLNLEGQSHPFAVLRAAELQRWVDDGDYRRVLAGEYPLRAEDKQASFTDELREAARSYKRSFDASTDPLLRTLRDLADKGTGAGQSVWDRVVRRDPS
jgi:hypothetical protein